MEVGRFTPFREGRPLVPGFSVDYGEIVGKGRKGGGLAVFFSSRVEPLLPLNQLPTLVERKEKEQVPSIFCSKCSQRRNGMEEKQQLRCRQQPNFGRRGEFLAKGSAQREGP
jgi:hypothetical protein